MVFFHALGSALLSVLDVGKMLLDLVLCMFNERLYCAFCDGKC